MALLFDITVPTNTLLLDSKRSGQITFTVASTSPRSLTARAQVIPSDPSIASWFQLEPGYARRTLDPHQTVQYLITLQVPPTAPAKDYSFHLTIAEESNPADNFSNSPDVKVSVPAIVVAPPPKPFPWWIIAVIAALVIVVVVVVAVVVTNNNNANANATATVQANSATRTAEFMAQQGATQTAEFLIQQRATQTAQFLNEHAATATVQFLQTK